MNDLHLQNKWNIKIRTSNFRPGYDVFIFREMPNGIIEVLRGDEIKAYQEGEQIDNTPSMYFEPEMAQEMVDALNRIGVKPRKGFMEGKLQATERHLEDLRVMLKLPKDKKSPRMK